MTDEMAQTRFASVLAYCISMHTNTYSEPSILHKSEQFSAFQILLFIPQKNSAHYPLPIFHILPLPPSGTVQRYPEVVWLHLLFS